MDKLMKAFNSSIEGLISVFEKEKSFQQDVILFAVFFPLAFFANIPSADKAILIFSLFFILIAEIINTAINTIVEKITTDATVSKYAKDIGNAIVLLSFISALLIWAMVYFR
jgi:diacylglycerol kinase (ATP)